MSSVQPILDRMNRAVFDILLRISNLFKDKQAGIAFLVLNFVHVLRMLREADAAPAGSRDAPGGGRLGSLGAGAIQMFEEHISNGTSLYAEDQLRQHCGRMVDFVKKAEQAQKRGNVAEGSHVPGFGPTDALPVVTDFGNRWQQVLSAIQRDVVKQFGSHKCDREVLQACLTQMLLYYTRMLEVLNKQGPEGAEVVRRAVGIPAIMYEIKKSTGK